MAIIGNPGAVPLDPYSQRLASLPAIPRRTTQGDGTEPGGSAMTAQKPQAPQATADDRAGTQIAAPPGKTLADASTEQKFRTIEQLIRSQDIIARNRWAIDTHFRRVRTGVPFSRLEKIPNQSVWVAKLPNGMSKESSAAVPNKSDDLCNKLEDTLMADPAKPDPMPHVEDESAKQAAELASQFLSMDGAEDGTNDVQTYRWALNNAFTAASSFLHYVVDPSGGGYQPLQKLAHPQATDPANPMMAMVPVGPPDPMTGQAPMVQERAVDPILRYISAPTPEAPAGQFVEDATQADRVWLPKIHIERLRRESVRTFPPNAPVEEAKATALILYINLSDARAKWPDTVGQMSDTELQGLASWKPVMSDLVVPYSFKAQGQNGSTGPSLDDVGSFSPLLQRRMFYYRLYVTKSPEYPAGYWVDVSGADGGKVLGEGDMEYTVQLPAEGKETRCKDLPLVMVRPMQDVNGGDPTGWPVISRFAGGSEADGTLVAAFMDVCDNMLHPHVFIGSTVAISEDEWFDRSLPIMLNPEDKPPAYEQFPTLPPILPMSEDLNKRMDTISGLTATAQGLDSSNAVSGTAKNATVRQALIALSGFQQQLHSAQTRGWRIKCQLVQAEFTTPQLMQYSGGEGSNEPQWWTGENFGGIDRVGIQPGTGTMMTPEAKAQYVAFLQQQEWMRPEDAAEVTLPGIRMDLGLPKNPFEQAIERSVGVFLKGPPEGWLEAQQAYLAQKQVFDTEQAQVQAQQQQTVAAQQQQAVDAPIQAQHAQALQLKQQDQEHQLRVEQEKAQLAMQMEEAKHRMTMEQKQADAQIAASAPRPETAPVQPAGQTLQPNNDMQLVIPPPDLSQIAAAMERMSEMIAALASKETPAPIIHLPQQAAPDVHVHPQIAPPHVHVPAQAAPVVHVEAAKAEPREKRKKRKSTITGPKGEKFTIEHGGDDE